MLSKLFYGAVLLGLVIWFLTKDFLVGLLPLLIYSFIRVIINLMLIVNEQGNRI